MNVSSSNSRIKRFFQNIPGRKTFGIYRFMPFFFVLGAGMEWFMINVRIGQETFYDVYRRKRSEREYQEKLEEGLITEPAESKS
ncbi:small integral membrane protein 4 [Protopterus annectens]|uniref:small integral membrane protein 4 n=1 Tax=Protopterus annectens TaxID=7888 RepID=UPI001CFBD1B6|nr:small integral membrane protein 4 [Protopterus annectens]